MRIPGEPACQPQGAPADNACHQCHSSGHAAPAHTGCPVEEVLDLMVGTCAQGVTARVERSSARPGKRRLLTERCRLAVLLAHMINAEINLTVGRRRIQWGSRTAPRLMLYMRRSSSSSRLVLWCCRRRSARWSGAHSWKYCQQICVAPGSLLGGLCCKNCSSRRRLIS